MTYGVYEFIASRYPSQSKIDNFSMAQVVDLVRESRREVIFQSALIAEKYGEVEIRDKIREELA